ncbi:hypothetical protein ISN44_As12g020720 [Arabidopsis suecica]|uniref:NYN domain-containing protein n=1 Tax=Arabidopsis suecica TaxID=45249 RepID=A0A8T1YL47_ARASU|nr:hypothetical protein ISN44_As12g020720 [Arabidopsis suecica]
MSGLFPPATTRDMSGRQTCCILDMEDYSIPDGLCPHLIKKKIKKAMLDSGYRGKVEVWACVAENTWSDELRDKFESRGICVCLTSQVELLFWAWNAGTSNVLILSNHHEEMEQYPRFSRFRKALESKGYCVVSAKPETLINQSIIEEEQSGKLRGYF